MNQPIFLFFIGYECLQNSLPRMFLKQRGGDGLEIEVLKEWCQGSLAVTPVDNNLSYMAPAGRRAEGCGDSCLIRPGRRFA